MKKDPLQKLIDESFEMFEEEPKKRVPQIMGLPYQKYVALMIFVDAFSEIAVKEYPNIAEKLQKPGRDSIENVWDYFDSLGLDVLQYLDTDLAQSVIDKINDFWGDHLSVQGLVVFDKDALGSLMLRLLGHDASIDRTVAKFLQNQGVEEPGAHDVGLDIESKRYHAAYEAMEDIDLLSRDKLSESILDKFLHAMKPGQEKEPKVEATARKLIETILKQVGLRYHLEKEKGDEGTVFRHRVQIAKKNYILKSYVIHDTGYFGTYLWDHDEGNILLIVTLGYLKDYYALVAFGRQRLKAWMETNHGSSRSE